ncbi:MAG: hypothetical protein R6W67_07725 [Bacteroidales bacterium]
MRTYTILLVLTLVLGVVYFILDRQLFYYGRNDFNLYHLLPLNVVPEQRPDFEGGFGLKDDYGFTIAAKGNTYKFNGKDILINEVVNYYFNTDRVIAQVVDVNNESYYVELSGNRDGLTKQDIMAKVWSERDAINLNGFRCVGIKEREKHIGRLVLPRNFAMFAVIALFIVLIYKTVRLLRKSSK